MPETSTRPSPHQSDPQAPASEGIHRTGGSTTRRGTRGRRCGGSGARSSARGSLFARARPLAECSTKRTVAPLTLRTVRSRCDMCGPADVRVTPDFTDLFLRLGSAVSPVICCAARCGLANAPPISSARARRWRTRRLRPRRHPSNRLPPRPRTIPGRHRPHTRQPAAGRSWSPARNLPACRPAAQHAVHGAHPHGPSPA